MAPRHGFVARLILVIAVVGCLVGMGHARGVITESAPAAMDHATMAEPHGAHAAPTGAGAGQADGHSEHRSHATDCCASTAADYLQAVTALPAALDHVALVPPAPAADHAASPAPPRARPPDLCSLCVQRT